MEISIKNWIKGTGETYYNQTKRYKYKEKIDVGGHPLQNYREAWYENNGTNKLIQLVPPITKKNMKNVIFKAYRFN
jgi:hypothetical protein